MPKVYREILTSERQGNFGFTVTTTTGEDSWTSNWVHVPLVRSLEDAGEYAQAACRLMAAYDEGD